MASGGPVLKSGFLKIEIDGKYETQFVELTTTALNFFDKKEKSSFFFVESGKRDKNGSIPIDYHSHVINSTAVSSSGHGFTINRDGKCFKFMADTIEEKRDWMAMIDDIINEEETDARLCEGSGSTPVIVAPLRPIDTPAARATYKSYFRDLLEVSDSRVGPWKERCCILSMEVLTFYCTSSTSTSAASDWKGAVKISQSTEVHIEDDDLDENRSHRNDFIFRLKTQDREVFLAAPSEESRLHWMNAIHSVKKMNMCRMEGDLATMWQWEGHLKATMRAEHMPTDPKLRVRSASIFGFRPGGGECVEDAVSTGAGAGGAGAGGSGGAAPGRRAPSARNIVPTGLNRVFDSIGTGASSTMSGLSSGVVMTANGLSSGVLATSSGISSGVLRTASGVSSGVMLTASGLGSGIQQLDNGRKLVQGGIVGGTGTLLHTLDSAGRLIATRTFRASGKEDFEARSDSFCEYMQDEESEEEEEEGEAGGGDTWKTTATKNVTGELQGKMAAVGKGMGVLAGLVVLFMTHAVFSDLGYSMMAIECGIISLLLFLSYQQILGHLLGVAVRYKLTKSAQGDGNKFGIHIEAIQVNVGMDQCSVEVRGLRWSNPDTFKENYGEDFLRVKTIRVAVPTLSLLRVLLEKRHILKVDQVFIDSPLVTLAQIGEGVLKQYNVLGAVGQDNEAVKSEPPPPPPPPTEEEQKSASIFCIDLNSFVLINLKIRLRNVFKVSSVDLVVPHVVMTRPELTGPPGLAHRRPLPVPQLASVLVKELGAGLVAGNKVAMLTILSSSGARHLMALFDPRNLARLFSSQ